MNKFLRDFFLLIRVMLKALIIVFEVSIQALWVIVFFLSLESNLKRKERIFVIPGTLGETFLNLLMLNEEISNSEQIAVFIYEKFKGLISYFPKLERSIHFLGNKRFMLFFRTEQILKWNGTIAFLRKRGVLLGLPEIVTFRNMTILAQRFAYFRPFYYRRESSAMTQAEYVKFMIASDANPYSAGRYLRRKSAEACVYAMKNSIVPGKTVILAPYSNFLGTLSKNPDFLRTFEEIGAFLTDLGYLVLTNVDPRNSEPIRGTRPICPPIELIIDFAELCGTVIALRSGFTDMVACSSARLFVYYPELSICNKPAIEYFSLSLTSNSSRIFEYTGTFEGFLEFIKENF